MHEMGGVRELEQTLVCTLMAEFARLQLILGEDLTKSLSGLCSELETSSEALSSDLLSVLNLHPGDPAFPRVKELIQKHQQSISMKVNLPLMELEAAREDLGGFLQRCLCKLSSNSKSWEMIEELSQTPMPLRNYKLAHDLIGLTLPSLTVQEAIFDHQLFLHLNIGSCSLFV